MNFEQSLKPKDQRGYSPESKDYNGGPGSKFVSSDFAQVDKRTDINAPAKEADEAESQLKHECGDEPESGREAGHPQKADGHGPDGHVHRQNELSRSREEEEVDWKTSAHDWDPAGQRRERHDYYR